jgi:uncharacterized protein (DUF1800 family)
MGLPPSGVLPVPAPLIGGAPAPTRVEASRFLAQATFGPSAQAIDELCQLGYDDWLSTQLALPATSHVARFQRTAPGKNDQQRWRQEAWWWSAITAPDQLRQRVAFALSEILVVSDLGPGLGGAALGLAHYYDVLVNGAFGSFRQLLHDVTVHPVMGQWLSLAGSTKANPAKGTHPDENFARELMQLFTIGDVGAYTQAQVEDTARALTGWVHDWSTGNPWTTPMVASPARHDTGAKVIVGGARIAAGGTVQSDLDAEHEAVVDHPSTASFVTRLLIQRLVTSNPTSGYVARAAAVFSATPGDLTATVSAILTDDEARHGIEQLGTAFGKVREPLLRVTHLWRALGGQGTGGRYDFPAPEVPLAQAALRAPSVFGFFSPGYTAPALSQLGLVAPELQLANDVSLPTADDFFFAALTHRTSVPAPVGQAVGLAGGQDQTGYGQHNVSVDLTALTILARDPSALLDELDVVLLAGALPGDLKQRLATYLATVPDATNRAAEAVYLVMASPAYLVQR